MKATERTAGNPGRRAVYVFAGLALALFGVVLGKWVQMPAEQAPVGDLGKVTAADPSTGPSPLSNAWLLGAAGLSLGLAVVLGRRAGRSASDANLRDPATDLYLPGYVTETVANLAARDDRAGRSQLALVLLEVEYLEDIARRHGRAAVERLLTYAGRLVRGQTREGDLPMRDGDRFAVYLQCEDAGQAVAFFRRLAMLLSREQFAVDGDEIKLALRARIVLRRPGEEIDDVLRRAASEAPISP